MLTETWTQEAPLMPGSFQLPHTPPGHSETARRARRLLKSYSLLLNYILDIFRLNKAIIEMKKKYFWLIRKKLEDDVIGHSLAVKEKEWRESHI